MVEFKTQLRAGKMVINLGNPQNKETWQLRNLTGCALHEDSLVPILF